MINFILFAIVFWITVFFAIFIIKELCEEEHPSDPNKGKYGLFKGCETTICSECKIKARCCEEALYFYYNPTLV